MTNQELSAALKCSIEMFNKSAHKQRTAPSTYNRLMMDYWENRRNNLQLTEYAV